MVNHADLLPLSSTLASETRQTWFRKPNDGPHYHTSMSKFHTLTHTGLHNLSQLKSVARYNHVAVVSSIMMCNLDQRVSI